MRDRSDATDHELVEAVRSGDDRAFERLYHRYHRRIAAYIYGMVHDYGRAEDLTQDVFMSALRRMRETDREIAFKPWIYEIAKNACIDAFRRSRRAEEVSYDAEEGLGAADHRRLVTTGPTPDAAVDTKMSLDNLRGAFGGLSEAHHQILVMREFEGLSYREIGERLGMSRPSVESTLFRARRRLTEEYEELVTGQRCLRVQSLITQAGEGALGTRDQRRLSRHISHCQPCRRHARMAGLDVAAVARRPVREKIAAFLPLPAFLRQRWGGGGDSAASSLAASHGGQALTQLSTTAAQYGDTVLGGWAKAAAAAAAVAVAGIGVNSAAPVHGLSHGASLRDDAVVTRAISPRKPIAAASGPSVAAPSTAGTSQQTTKSSSGARRAAGKRSRRSGASGPGGSNAAGGGSSSTSSSSAGSGAGSSTKGATGGALDTVNRLVGGGGGGGTGTGAPSAGGSQPASGGTPDTGLSLPDPTGVLPQAPDSGGTSGSTLPQPVGGAVDQASGTAGQVTGAADQTVTGATDTVTGVVGGGG